MVAEDQKKLSKKELKSLQHKAKTDEKSKLKLQEYETKQKEEEEFKANELKRKEIEENERLKNEPVKKKRKTRRGKKGRTTTNTGFKATLFIGNIPKDIKEEELREHFKAVEPFEIRLRLEKGFAFLEFIAKEDNQLERAEIHRRTQMGLLLHHTKLGNRTINVELSAGGGGNSKVRREKISKKNEEAEKDRKKRILKENLKKGLVADGEKGTVNENGEKIEGGNTMNAERAKMLELD